MASAAQLDAVISDLNDTDDISVFLSEQRHGAHRLRFINGLALDNNRNALPYLFIHAALNIGQLLRRTSPKWEKSKRRRAVQQGNLPD